MTSPNGVNSVREYPSSFGYTPSLYNEDNVIEEESSNFEDSHPVSEQSLDLDDQSEGYESSNAGGYPNNQYYGGDFYITHRARDSNSLSEFESLENYARVDPEDFHEYHRNSSAALSGVEGFNVETNLFEGGVEIAEMEAVETSGNFEEEEEDEVSLPTHDNLVVGLLESQKRRGSIPSSSVGGGPLPMGANEHNMMTANQSMTSVSSQLVSAAGGALEEYDDRMSYLDDETSFQHRMRQDTLDAVSTASEDFCEEELPDEHNISQHAFPVLLENYPESDNRINVQQTNLQMSNNGLYSSPYGFVQGTAHFNNDPERAPKLGTRQERANTLSPQTMMDDDHHQNQFDTYDEYTNTSQQISTDFSQPFSNKHVVANDPEKSDSKSNSTIKSNNKAPPISQLFSTQYSTDTEGHGINLYSKNMRQVSTAYDPIYESRNYATEKSNISQISTNNAWNKINAVSISPSNVIDTSKTGNLRELRQPVIAANHRNNQIADAMFDSSTPNHTIKASDSDGELSVKEDATKVQLYKKLQSERDQKELLKQENYAYQQQINNLNLQLAGTRDTLDQLRVAARVGLDVSHPDSEGDKGNLVNVSKLPNKFQMPKIGRARIDDPRHIDNLPDSPENNNQKDAEATARLNMLQGEAERLRASLTNYPIKEFSETTETWLKRIADETNKLSCNCDEAFEEFGDNIDPQQRKNLEFEVVKVRTLLDQTAATRQEIEAHKQKIELDILHQMRLNGNLAQNYNYANHVAEDSFHPPEISKAAQRSHVNEAPENVETLSPEFEKLKRYNMKRQKSMNETVASHQGNGHSVSQINMGQVGQVQKYLQEQPGYVPGELENLLNGKGYVNGSGVLPTQGDLDQEQLEERHSNIEEGVQDVRLEDFNAEYPNNMFKPISMNDSVQTGSVDQRMQSSGTTPVQSLKVGNQNLNSLHQKPNVNKSKLMASSDEVVVKMASPEKSVIKRRSSIPRLDPNYVANNLHVGDSPRLASPNRRHTISASEERKTFKLGLGGNEQKPDLEKTNGKVVNTRSSLLSKNRPLAARLHNEDNDSGFVGSGPSHFGNLTSENSYSSSRDQTPAHSQAVRRSKTSVGDKKMSRQEGGALYGKKVDRTASMIVRSKLDPSEEKLTVNMSDRDSDGLDSLDLESPNSSIGSVKRRPTVIENPNRPKSNSTKPQTNSIGIDASVKSHSKMAQTARDMSTNNSPGYEEPNENGNNPVSFKFSSPRTNAFKSYNSSSSEDNLPGKSAENLNRRATGGPRNYISLFRRSEAPPNNKTATKQKNSSLASASKFSKSENALEKSRSNQAKIDEIEKEIMSLKNQLLESVCRTPSTSANIVSSTPRRDTKPTRHESFNHGTCDKGEDSGIARYSDRLYGSEELSDMKTQLNASRSRISDLGKVRSFDERHECNKNGSCRRTLASNTDGSRKTSRKNLSQTSPVISSDSDEYVTHSNKKSQSSRIAATKGVGSGVDSAFDIICKDEPKRRSKGKVRPNVHHHGTQMTTFEDPNVGQVPPTSVPVGSSTFVSSSTPNQFHHTTLFGASSTSTAEVTSASILAYLPVVGVWQPAAPTIQPLFAPAATATIIPQHAPSYHLLYNQPAVALASAPIVGTNTTTIPTATSHVVQTETTNPIRFYYKTDSKFVDAGAATGGTEQMMTRSAETLYRNDSGRRKYDRNGHRLRSDNSRLLESINNADMAARQLNKLSKNMASSVYSHLNAADF